MKKLLLVIFVVAFLILASVCTVYADDSAMVFDTSPIFDSLSDEVKQSLEAMGTYSTDAQTLADLSFEKIIAQLCTTASDNISSPLKGLLSITAILLICSVLSAYKSSLSSEVSVSMNLVCTLCITCACALPAISVIKQTCDVINTASAIMLAYVPIMVLIMSTMGQAVSGASYYTVMIGAGEGIGQLSSNVILPMLNMFLGLSITAGVSPEVNLSGFTKLISKTIKWILTFAMTIFTALLSFKQIISTSVDGVSARAVRFTLNSFIPIVGSALSDAYKTVQSSVGLLKSGVGVFVIISVAVVFLPVIMQSLMWIITLSIGKSLAEVLNLSQPQKLLEALVDVFSTLLAVVLCIMSVYIISTALVLMLGGGAV